MSKFNFCIEYTKQTKTRVKRDENIFLKNMILEEYQRFVSKGLASVVLNIDNDKLYQINPVKRLAIIKKVNFVETKKKLICELEAKYIENMYFKTFENFQKFLDISEIKVVSLIQLTKENEVKNTKILAFTLVPK